MALNDFLNYSHVTLLEKQWFLKHFFLNVLFLFPEITGLIKCAIYTQVIQTNAHRAFEVT